MRSGGLGVGGSGGAADPADAGRRAGQLMLGADGNVYVVKFQNNPQHMRMLANEYLASRIAAAAGLVGS